MKGLKGLASASACSKHDSLSPSELDESLRNLHAHSPLQSGVVEE